MKKIISPHVNIYKFPITAVSSITNRLTGLALTGLFIGTGISNIFYLDLIKKYDKLENNYKKVINYSVIFPATYHTFGGIRHFIWDKYPQLLNNKQVKKSSFFLMGGSVVYTILFEKFVLKSNLKNII